MPANIQENKQALQSLHKLLMSVHVKKGELYCEECERVYPIMSNGIPNMLLRDDEVSQKKKQKKQSKKSTGSRKTRDMVDVDDIHDDDDEEDDDNE